METYTLGYKFRIYPDKEQTELINRTLGCCRFVYNHFLAVRRDQWQTNHKSIGYLETARLLTDLKKREETSWLKEVDSMALQESLRNLLQAAHRLPALQVEAQPQPVVQDAQPVERCPHCRQ